MLMLIGGCVWLFPAYTDTHNACVRELRDVEIYPNKHKDYMYINKSQIHICAQNGLMWTSIHTCMHTCTQPRMQRTCMHVHTNVRINEHCIYSVLQTEKSILIHVSVYMYFTIHTLTPSILSSSFISTPSCTHQVNVYDSTIANRLCTTRVNYNINYYRPRLCHATNCAIKFWWLSRIVTSIMDVSQLPLN